MTTALSQRCIAVPETRQLDVLTRLLETRGARVWPCPLVGIHDVPEPASVDAWLRAFCDNGVDLLILLTGEGLRRLLARARRIGLEDAFVTRLGTTGCLTRGPKPAAALRELGLRSSLSAVQPTTAGVIESLRDLKLSGRRVGVQLYGDEPNRLLVEHLQAAGATVDCVAPYRYADSAETDQVVELIKGLAAGSINAIAFTSSPQVRRLFQVARERDLQDELNQGWRKTIVAAVGPLVREALEQRGVTVTVMPESAYFIKPLVQALVDEFARDPRAG